MRVIVAGAEEEEPRGPVDHSHNQLNLIVLSLISFHYHLM